MGSFFDKDEEKEEKKGEVPPTVKVGEKEYTQDELSQLVGLGETARDYETKWNRPISQFYPDYTQKSQKLADFERQQTESEAAKKVAEEAQKQKELDEKVKNNQLSPEETRKLALQQARDLGIVTKDDFNQEVNKAVVNVLAGKQLIDDTQAVISQAEEKGQPKTTVDELLKYMDENGVKKPEVAYKLMFEAEIDKWKEETLKGIQPPRMQTQASTTAGGKAPPPPQPLTRDNLAQAIRESLTRSRGV